MDDLKTVIELCIKAGWLPSENVREVRECIEEDCHDHCAGLLTPKEIRCNPNTCSNAKALTILKEAEHE